MDTKFQPSFIPKKPMGTRDFGAALRSAKINLFTLIGIIIFIVAIGLAAFAYLYKEYTENNIEKMKIQITEARAKFNPELIGDLTRTDERLKLAKQILDKHIGATAVFELIARNTYKNIRYKSFTFTYGSDNSLSVIVNGEAKSFNTVVLQSDRFRGNKYFDSPIFSGLSQNDKSYVDFMLTTRLKSTVALYKNMFSDAAVEESGFFDEDDAEGPLTE